MSKVCNMVGKAGVSTGAVKVMTQGQVSTTSNYTGTNFDNPISNYDFVEVHIFRAGTDVGYDVARIPVSSVDFYIVGGAYKYTLRLTPTRISCIKYEGQYVDLYVDVYAYHKAA